MMLSFQNLHQFAFNLSQVTSVVSSTYIRLTSTSVKKKPEIDVYCSKNFLTTLEALGQTDKKFENVRFGPKFQDMQWIYSKDVNFRFTTLKPVNEPDFCLSLDKNDIKNFHINVLLDKLRNSQHIESKQMKILEDLETNLMRKSIWNESFVSKRSFDENKQSSFCANQNNQTQFSSPLCSRLAGTTNSYSNFSKVYNVQKRGFKTRRSLDSREKMTFFSKINKQWNDLLGIKANNAKDKISESRTMAEMMKNEAITTEEKLKLKVSFAEGYMIGVNELKKRSTAIQKFLKGFWIIVLLYFIASQFLSNNEVVLGKRKIFQIGFDRHGEINPEEIDVTFSDVKGVQEVKDELAEIVEFLRDPARFSSLGGKLPKGVLLIGPPGTGKTLLARAVAGEANVPFFHASGSEFDEIFVGEGARRVRNLFRSAKAKAPSIIFIDEIDAVGSQRKRTVLHPYANQTINQLLSEMDGFNKNEGVIVIGATNREKDLDKALRRPGRFDVEVRVPLPDLEGRKEILKLYLGKILCKNIDIAKIARATSGCTGADLEAIINHAAIKAATDGAPHVTMEYLEYAKDKILLGPEKKSGTQTESDELITAYHESGHTIVAYFSDAPATVDKVTIVPRGKSLGHTALVQEVEYSHITKNSCLASLDVMLGGRAAEELIFGPNFVTANASDDLERATDLASRMVKNFGMSEKLGVRTLKKSEEDFITVNQFGQTLSDQVDMEVKKLIQESYERSKNILKKHSKKHKLLAEALMKYKTLSPEEVKAILGERKTPTEVSSEKTIPAPTEFFK